MSATAKRKLEHLRVCLERDVQARAVRTGFDDIHLVHRCLEGVDSGEIDTSTRFLGREFGAPLFISAMTGGVEEAMEVNASLAEAAERLRIGMCLGSQRAGIEDPSLERTYRVARERAPTAFLSANIGISEVLRYESERVLKAVEMLGADALTVHLNALQELLQSGDGGTLVGTVEKLGEVVRYAKVPVIVKETGSGVSREDASTMREVGVRAVEVAGAGGTSWAAVEHYRSLDAGDRRKAALGASFWDWGIPTMASLLEVYDVGGLEIVASGGVGNGIHVAKALAMGAALGGLAHRLLKPAMEGAKQVVDVLQTIVEELKVVMALTGSRRVQDLRTRPVVVTGFTADWLKQRGIRLVRGAR